MALTTQNSRKDLRKAALQLGAAVQGYQLVGGDLSNALSNLNLGKTRNRADISLGMPKRRQNRTATRKRKGGNQNQNKLDLASASIPGGLAGSQRIRSTFKDLYALTNTIANGGSWGWSMGSVTTASANGLFSGGSYMPRAYQFSILYRQYLLHSVSCEFVPYASTSNSGSVAMGFDPDPSAGVSTALASPLRHRVSTLSDLTKRATITYRPAIDLKKTPKFTYSDSSGTGVQAGTRSDDEVSFGTLQVVTANSMASAAPIGYLVWTIDVTFMGPL